jgi:hypothetical protein
MDVFAFLEEDISFTANGENQSQSITKLLHSICTHQYVVKDDNDPIFDINTLRVFSVRKDGDHSIMQIIGSWSHTFR